MDYDVSLLPTDPGYDSDCAGGDLGCDTNSGLECDTANPPDSDDACLDYNVELQPGEPGYNEDCIDSDLGCDTSTGVECDTAAPPNGDDECLDYDVELQPGDPDYNENCIISDCVDTGGNSIDCPEDTAIEDTGVDISVGICDFACAYSAVMSGTDPNALPEEWDNSNCSVYDECINDENTETDWHNCVNNIDLAGGTTVEG